MITDGDAMGVAAQISKHLGGAAECWLRVHNPVLPKQSAKENGECLRMPQRFDTSCKLQLLVAECTFDPGDELASEDATENFDRQEEWVAWTDPFFAIERKSSGRDHAMQVGMEPSSRTIP